LQLGYTLRDQFFGILNSYLWIGAVVFRRNNSVQF
jgi:hypothetical protein